MGLLGKSISGLRGHPGDGLLASKALVHYDPSLPLKLAGVELVYGIGAVISHVMEDGSERPIAFASRMLSAMAEQNYKVVASSS